jgi:hypothetical protein
MSKVIPLPGYVSAEEESSDLVTALEKVMIEAKAGNLRAVAVAYMSDDSRMHKSCAGRYSDLFSSIEVMKYDLMREFRAPEPE